MHQESFMPTTDPSPAQNHFGALDTLIHAADSEGLGIIKPSKQRFKKIDMRRNIGIKQNQNIPCCQETPRLTFLENPDSLLFLLAIVLPVMCFSEIPLINSFITCPELSDEGSSAIIISTDPFLKFFTLSKTLGKFVFNNFSPL